MYLINSNFVSLIFFSYLNPINIFSKPHLLGLRPTSHMTGAQAYAARWDLSPLPQTRPIIPREPIIEPFSPRINIERNLFTPKCSSSLKDKRSISKITPLYDHRSWTLDEIQNMKLDPEKKNDKPHLTHPSSVNNSSLLATQLLNLRPKSTPCASPSCQ